MAKTTVKIIDLGRADGTRAVLNKPFPECIIESLMFVASDLAGAVNGRFVGAEGNISHERSVHENSVKFKMLANY